MSIQANGVRIWRGGDIEFEFKKWVGILYFNTDQIRVYLDEDDNLILLNPTLKMVTTFYRGDERVEKICKIIEKQEAEIKKRDKERKQREESYQGNIDEQMNIFQKEKNESGSMYNPSDHPFDTTNQMFG
ncbi:hypothetical protein KAJ41_01680 [Candidatus Parcubacteria bacterium]|nr:hypothetical protein [Candidatus Parcubacteria bacterium]